MSAYRGKLLRNMTPTERESRVRALLAAHNTAAIPTQYLPAAQRQQRSLNARLNAPVVPGSSLTNRDLARQAKASVALQYGPQETQLNQQLASNANQAGQTGGYYQAWIDQLKAAQAQQPTITQGTVGQLAKVGTDMQGAAGAQNTALLSQMQADAAQRGATVDPSVATRLAQGTNVNAGIQGAQAGTAQLLGQAQAGYIGALIGAAQAGKIQALNQVGSDRAGLLAKQAALKASEGAANVDYRAKAQSAESQNVLNSALAQSTIDSRTLSGQVAQANAKTAARRASTAAKTARTTQQTKDATFAASHEGYTPTAFAKLPTSKQLQVLRDVKKAETVKTPKTSKATKPVSGPGSLSSAEEQKRVGQINQLADILRNPPTININDPTTGKPTGKTRKATTAEILAEVRGGKSPLGKDVPPQVINAGRSVAENKGAIGQWGADNAHSIGVHVNGRWKIVKARKPKPGNSVGAITQGVQGATG